MGDILDTVPYYIGENCNTADEVTNYLAERGADINGVYGIMKQTLLHAAALDTLVKPRVVKLLLDAGADPTIKDGFKGDTPLLAGMHKAAMGSNADIALEKVLIMINEGAGVNSPGPQGQYPLHLCAYLIYREENTGLAKQLATLLVAKGARKNSQDDQGNTAMDIIIRNIDFISSDRDFADIMPYVKFFASLGIEAGYPSKRELKQMLDTIESKNLSFTRKDRVNLIQVVKVAGLEDLIDDIKSSADPFQLIDSENLKGLREYVRESGDVNVVYHGFPLGIYIFKKFPTDHFYYISQYVTPLLIKEFQADATDPEQKTIAHYLVKVDSALNIAPDVAKFWDRFWKLPGAIQSFSMKDSHGDTPLHLMVAAKDLSSKLFERFLWYGKRKVKFGITNSRGQTALEIAEQVHGPDSEIVQMLGAMGNRRESYFILYPRGEFPV